MVISGIYGEVKSEVYIMSQLFICGKLLRETCMLNI